MENSSSTPKWTPEYLELENKEYELAEELKHNTNKDIERDARILMQLGLTYKKRGELLKEASYFVKASALYNSALIRSKNTKNNAELNVLRAENERSFFDLVLGIKDGNISCHFIEQQKKRLEVFRDDIYLKLNGNWNKWNQTYDIDAKDERRIQQEKIIIDQMNKISSEISEFMKTIVCNILHECFGILGEPPQQYAVIGLGSLARSEMTPYSDLESAILIEDDTRDKQYFRNLAHTFHLYVLNFGETPLPALAIKSLNDFDKDGGSWFFDGITCNGFCMDGAMPWACKTPIGRPDREHKQGVELIQTPENMSKFQQKDIAEKEGYHLADILSTCTLIHGSEHLLDQYVRLLSIVEFTKDRHQRAVQALQVDAKKYEEKMSFGADVEYEPTKIDVKQELFRFPSLLINAFRFIHSLENTSKSPWLVLKEMEEKLLISADGSHNIQMAISIAVLLRLMTCLHNKGQINSLSFLSKFEIGNAATVNSNHDTLFSSENVQWIIRYYFTVLPLIRYVSGDKLKIKQQDKQTFYDYSNKIKALVYLKNGLYEPAAASYKEYLQELLQQRSSEVNADIARTFHNLGYVYIYTGDYDSALYYMEQALPIRENKNVAKTLDAIGTIYGRKREYDRAMCFFQKALKAFKNAYGDKPDTCLSTILANIGTLYTVKGDYDNALSYFHKSLKMRHDDYNLGLTLCNIGTVYDKKHEYDKAMLYLKQSLEIQRKLHGNTVHPEMSVLLNNIGLVYLNKGDYDNAILNFRQSLELQTIIGGKTIHHIIDIVKTLGNIGSAYFSKKFYDHALLYHRSARKGKLKLLSLGYSGLCVDEVSQRIGDLYRRKRSFSNALLNYQQSLVMHKPAFGDTADLFVKDALIRIGNVYHTMGDYDAALVYHEQAICIYIAHFEQSKSVKK